MKVEVVTDEARFLELKQPWNDCHACLPGGNPFLSHEWLHAWWQSFGQGAQLMVLVMHDGDEIVVAAPLFRTRQPYYGVPVEQILFIGTHTFDRLGFIRRTADADQMRELWSHLQPACKGRTLIRLEGLPVDDPMLAMTRDLPGMWAEESTSRLPFIPVDKTWEDYRQGLTHKFRSEMRTRVKVFARWGEWRLDVCRGRETGEHLAAMADLESHGAKSEKDAAFLADPRNFEFMSRLLAASGPAEPVLTRLLIDDKLVAYILGFIHGGVYCAYNTAYHPDYRKGSPGKWIMDQAIEFVFAEGLTEFDFLRGHFSYKDRWQPETRESCRRLLFAGNPLGWGLRTAVFEIRPRLKQIRGRGSRR